MIVCFNHIKYFDNIFVVKLLENLYLSPHWLLPLRLFDFTLLINLYCNLLVNRVVDSYTNWRICPFAYLFANNKLLFKFRSLICIMFWWNFHQSILSHSSEELVFSILQLQIFDWISEISKHILLAFLCLFRIKVRLVLI